MFHSHDARFPFRRFGLPALGILIGVTMGCSPAVQPTAPPAVDAAVDGPEAEASAASPEAAEAANQPRRAEVGVGRQGRSLDDETGVGRVIAQPAITLFAVRERAVFDIQIPQALQLFEALEGRKPKSHEEFMQRIIRDNRIELPELPAGREYRYEPEKGELWVHPSTDQ